MSVFDRAVFEVKELQKKINNICGRTIFIPSRRYRKSKLINMDFSIISNNCWGGVIYKKYNLPYLTPTVGLYFYADEYLRFLSNLQHYLSCEPIIIQRSNSKYEKQLSELKVYRYFPIGLIDDVEVVFLHYRNDKDAIEKWERRKKRVNFSKLIVKFNDRSLCTEKHLNAFEQLPFKNKICFTAKPYSSCSQSYVLPQKDPNSPYIKSDLRVFKTPLNVTNYINSL